MHRCSNPLLLLLLVLLRLRLMMMRLLPLTLQPCVVGHATCVVHMGGGSHYNRQIRHHLGYF
jgi:hypothetical protein